MKALGVEQMKVEMIVGYSKENNLSQLFLWHPRTEFKTGAYNNLFKKTYSTYNISY